MRERRTAPHATGWRLVRARIFLVCWIGTGVLGVSVIVQHVSNWR